MKDRIFKVIKREEKRQNNCLELIASENFASKNVRKALSSCLTNKYAEGYPYNRYYGGCEYVDAIEDETIIRACNLFNCKYANVQPHSGSQANFAAYRALEKYLINEGKLKDRKMKILTMDLNSGAHLTHGSPVSFSSNLYDFNFFELKNGKINFKNIENAIKQYKPDVLLSGYSAYPYDIDFEKFAKLAKKYKLLFMVDMAHIAGFVAAGYHQNPCEYADIVTSTTHKTLRGPRGGLILSNNEKLFKLIDSAVFPYTQGGPLENTIAAKGVCFKEASSIKFENYIKSVLENTKAFSKEMIVLGADCSLSENHLTILNTKKAFGLTGKEAEIALDKINITVNKNMLPNDTEKPNVTSGIRIGFAALTTRGLKTKQAIEIADIIFVYLKAASEYIKANKDMPETIKNTLEKVKRIVKTLKKV